MGDAVVYPELQRVEKTYLWSPLFFYQSAADLEYGLIVLWEMLENQAPLIEGREADIFAALLRIRYCGQATVRGFCLVTSSLGRYRSHWATFFLIRLCKLPMTSVTLSQQGLNLCTDLRQCTQAFGHSVIPRFPCQQVQTPRTGPMRLD